MWKSAEEIIAILEECKKYGLDMGAAAFKSIEAIEAAYNGCGPENFPPELRSRLDGLAEEFNGAILVHDCDFEDSDGTLKTLKEVTARFRKNTAKILRAKYPFFTVKQFAADYRLKRSRAIATKAALDLAISPLFSFCVWQKMYEEHNSNG